MHGQSSAQAAALAAGESRAIRRLQYGGLLRDAARGFILTLLGLCWRRRCRCTAGRDQPDGGGPHAGGDRVRPCRRGERRGSQLRTATRLKWLLAGAGVGIVLAGYGVCMTGRLRAMLRLLAVQGTWNYERMLGVGMGYAAEPLLEDLKAVDPARHGEAVVRSAEFFNCNPNLAGLALGATARAEYEGVPGAQIVRLRTALCSPLGAMGDELFWAGLVPALVGMALVRGGAGGRMVGHLGFLVATTPSASGPDSGRCGPGLRSGMQVGAAISKSWLPRAIERVGPAAGFAMGMVIPVAAGWYLRGFGWSAVLGASGVAMAGIALTRWFGPLLTTGALRAAGDDSPTPASAGGPVIEREATIVNQEGLHARPAARIVRLASTFDSEIEIAKDGVGVNGKSIMGVMMLAAECGSSITIRANGPDAEQAAEALVDLVASGFGEE